MQNHEKFNNVCSGIQSIVVSAAVLIGGGWTLYSFIALQSVEKARLELSEAREKLERIGNLQITIECSQTKAGSDQSHLLLISVKIQNTGGRHLTLHYPDGQPLIVKQVSPQSDGRLDVASIIIPVLYSESIHSDILTECTIRGGSFDIHHFAVPVKSSTLYLVHFSAELDSGDQKVSLQAGASSKQVWGASRYYYVSR